MTDRPMHEAVIISGCRTPIGAFRGALSSWGATQLGAIVVREAIRRAAIMPADVDEVILGNVLSAGLGQAPARQAALQAGLPASVAAVTINKMCGSGLKAVMLAAQAIRAGDAELIAAGGMESMSRAPHLLLAAREGFKFGHQALVDSMLLDGLTCAFDGCHMGAQAEHIARLHNVSRHEQDVFAYESQRRTAAAIQAGVFDDEIVFVLPEKGGEAAVTTDQGPRAETTYKSLAKLKPVFEVAGTVTAGNASQLGDGAAAVIVTSRRRAEALGHEPLASIVAYATAGVPPKDVFIAPTIAVTRVLKLAGLSIKDIDLFEMNEAFASQLVACMRTLELPSDKVNIHGGAIALGHPLGASGARVLVTLLFALRRHGLRHGLVALCLGGGNAVAMVVERST